MILKLEKLQIIHPDVTVDQAIKIAIETRLDLHTQQEQVEDSERKLKIAVNNMLPNLDLTGSVYVPDKSGNNAFPDFKNPQWDANVNLSVPLDKRLIGICCVQRKSHLTKRVAIMN